MVHGSHVTLKWATHVDAHFHPFTPCPHFPNSVFLDEELLSFLTCVIFYSRGARAADVNWIYSGLNVPDGASPFLFTHQSMRENNVYWGREKSNEKGG